jgi:tetratricopeptide (TPR) repeat protein
MQVIKERTTMGEQTKSSGLWWKAGILGLLLACLAVAGRGQIQGKIEGRVTDNKGNPMDKVSVVILFERTSAKFELTTGKEGHFAQVGLAPGYYQVTLNKPGYVSRTLEIKVSIAETSKFEAKLEAVEAAAERSLSDADRQFVKGNKLFAEGKFAEAAASYQDAVKLNAIQWAYNFNLGLAYKKLGQSAEALAAFAKAQELNPSSYGANKELAEALGKAGRLEEAKKYYLKAVELSADEPDALYNLGLVQAATGESEAAQASFEKCITLKPDYADAYYQLGTVEIGLNKVKEAVESLDKFLALAPRHEKAPIARQLLEALRK